MREPPIVKPSSGHWIPDTGRRITCYDDRHSPVPHPDTGYRTITLEVPTVQQHKSRSLRVLVLVSTLPFLLIAFACRAPEKETAKKKPAASSPYSPDIKNELAQFPATKIDYDRSLLDEQDKKVVEKLIDASRRIDEIFFRQVSERNPRMRAAIALDMSHHVPNAEAAFQWLHVNYGPWDRLNHDKPFLPGVGPKPKGAAFYPPDMTVEDFDHWIESHPQDANAMRSDVTVIRKRDGGLVAIPYSTYYKALLDPAAKDLRDAAALTRNAALKTYLEKRADAFASNDYYPSDLAWMDLDGKIEVVIGPYEVYEDQLLNYKASFESFVCVVDKGESAKLAVYARHLPAMEENLPIPEKDKNHHRGTDSPIKVVQEIFTSGEARAGVQTSAFNLPNDERVRQAKGSKKVLLKNVMQAKFDVSGKPIAERVLTPALRDKLSFDAYFNHTLFHELSHGLGPGIITGPDGKKVDTRLLLKNKYSMIEECKADTVGLWNILYAMKHKLITSFDREQLFATYTGMLFRSMRFGTGEAHGGAAAIEWNWMRQHGAIVPASDGHFGIDLQKFPEAIRSLSNELLMIEATGDYARAQKLVATYAKTNDEITGTIAKLKDIPVDIRPVYVAAGEH